MSLIRGALLAGRFRTQQELISMSHEDQRNTLILELTKRCQHRVEHLQSFGDGVLVGMGAVVVFLRDAGIRDDRTLETMTLDDQRNTLIVEIEKQTRLGIAKLQGLSNLELVFLGLGSGSSFIRGALLAGKFRTADALNAMSHEDQRNTLIVELTERCQQNNFQSFDDATLASMAAVLIFLRNAGIRDDRALAAMTTDDQRNTLIVEINKRTSETIANLQVLTSMDLVRVGLGGYPTDSMQQVMSSPLDVFTPAKPEDTSTGKFGHEGAVWYISLDNDDTITLCSLLASGAGTGGSAVAAATIAGGTAVFGPLWLGIVAALAAGAGYILSINKLGGNNGVDINGVVGMNGLVVTPRVGKVYGEMIKIARLGVSGRVIIELILASCAKEPALAAAWGIPVAAGIFRDVSAGTPLGWAIAVGVGIVERWLLGEDEPSPDLHGGVHADRDAVESWESFWLASVGEDTRVSLLSWQGLFSARNGGGSSVFANRPQVKEWETWRLIRHDDKTVSFQTIDGHYLTARDGGGRECWADAERIGPFERFFLVNLPDGRIALKTQVKGKFVSVQRDL